MLEYAERRSALACGSRSSRKRRRLLNGAFAEGESTVQLVVDQEDEELCDTRVMAFGTDSSWPEIGYVDLSLIWPFRLRAQRGSLCFQDSSTIRTR